MRPTGLGQRLLIVSLSFASLLLIGSPASSSGGTLPPLLGTVIFTSGRDGTYPSQSLYSVDSDGGNFRRLADGITSSSWSPNGSKLAVIETHEQKHDLALVSPRGTRQLLETGGSVVSFAWSPAGRRIAYDSGPADGRQVAVIDIASGKVTAVGAGSSPQWAPDGKHVSFFRGQSMRELWVANPDGSHAHLVASDIARDVKWSPDSQHIALIRSNALYVTAISAPSGAVGVFFGYATNVALMSWSPTGKRLVYETHDGTDNRGHDLWSAFVADVNGKRKPTRVFKDISSLSSNPAWSPRSGEIALTALVDGSLSLYLIHPDGKGRRRVLTDNNIGTPVWSRDGRQFTVSAGIPRDAWVVDSLDRSKTRVSEGFRYGYANTPVRMLEGVPPALVVPGTAVTPEIPTNSVVDGLTLATVAPVNQLAADGSTVAIHYARGDILDYNAPRDYRCLETWKPLSGKITRFNMATCDRAAYCCSLGAGGFVDLTLAGDRVAWSQFTHFAGLDIFDLYTGTLAQPRPDLVPGVCPDNRYGDCLFPETDLQGDGSLLVFDTWDPSCTNPSFPRPCSTSPKRNGRLWRMDGGTAVRIAASAGALTPVSVDAGRVLVDHQNGTLELLDQDGHSLAQLANMTAGFTAAKLNGSDVAVFTAGSVLDYDAASGTLLHQWPLGCGDETAADLQNGVAVYICGRNVHLLWLADGKDITLPALGDSPYAQLEAAGLFYAYKVADPNYQGRVTFTPFSALPHP